MPVREDPNGVAARGLEQADERATGPARARLLPRGEVRDGFVSGGTRRNLEWVQPFLDVGAGVSADDLLLLADAQTSGGLLVVGEVPGGVVIGETVAGHPRITVGFARSERVNTSDWVR